MKLTKKGLAAIESLETRCLLSLSVPGHLSATITWGIAGGTQDEATFKWQDADSSVTFVAEWSDSPTSWTEDSGHTLSYASAGTNFEATQDMNAGYKRYYRVKAVSDTDESAWSDPLSPEVAGDDVLQVSATADSEGIHLSWPAATLQPFLPSNPLYWKYNIYRKSRTATTWGDPLNSSPIDATSYVDTSTEASPGHSYDYQVKGLGLLDPDGTTANRMIFGYISAANDAPLVDSRGTVLIVIDSSLFDPERHSSYEIALIDRDIAQYEQDLIGKGWRVREVNDPSTPDMRGVARDDDVATDATQAAHIKQLINDNYDSDVNSIVLIGHVPVPYSGDTSYDGHGQHAMPTDQYYADADATPQTWGDSSADISYPSDDFRGEPGWEFTPNTPGDGRFDVNLATLRMAA